MTPKYLFIDDEIGKPTQAMLDGFNDTKQIDVSQLTLSKGDPFEEVCKRIKDKFTNHQYDGVLIDLCLDGTGANSLSFKAQPFAQQIRSWASEGKISQFPIVLCSTLDKDGVYKKDSASHDLFDYYFYKTDVDFVKESVRLKSLAEGYKMLNKQGVKVSEYLGREDFYLLDDNIVDYMSGSSSYDIARRIIKDLLPYSGILIDPYVVAARMGIDMATSNEGWEKLKDAIFREAAFTGVFSSGWKRCWSDKVNAFFMNISEGQPYQIMNAEERVDVLKKAGFDGLEAAKPVPFNNSSYFNTACFYSGLPIDSMEGIPVEEHMSLKLWQENHYVSFLYVARGDFKEENLCPEGIKKMNEIKQRIKDEQAKNE